jgi:DNA-binding NarL/FixJ family response regulator
VHRREPSARAEVVLIVRVLVVDDSRPFLDAAVDVVNVTAGFELVGTAGSGEEAVALARSTRPDLVLLDLRMPGISGREAGSQIGAARPETKIVLMTADSGRSFQVPEHMSSSYAVIEKRRLTPAVLTAVWESFSGR